MSEAVHLQRLPELDDPWRRLPWVTLAAIAIWIALLAFFSFLLERSAPPPAEIKPVEARIIELPPEVGGLAGGGGAPAHAPPVSVPKPKAAPVHVRPAVKPKKSEPPPMPVSPNGTATTSAASAQPPATSSGAGNGGASTEGGAEGGIGNGVGSGTGSGGIGSDSLGAHALYAPVPEIPDDLREEAINTVAIAHFRVTYDGQITVSLVKMTENPRLNKLILDTLKQWRFFPAMKNGVAIDSEFDLRIPITVQ
ncbi:MAG TPA: energy transducer TonB [Candidatus Binataceae bacterium]|nr:energy transducer TonB [Candidatus Binataceae bacterium]